MNERPLTWRVRLIDAAVVVTVVAVALSPLADVYAGSAWLVAGAGGAVIGLGVAELSRRAALGPLLTLLSLTVAYLALAPALAARDQAVGSVLPSLEAERTVVVGVVDSWRTVLTLPVPISPSDGVLVVPLVVAMVGSLIAGVLLWRTRAPGTAVVPLVLVFAVAAAFGVREADVPLWRGLALAATAVVWMRWRAMRHLRLAWRRRAIAGAVLLGLSGLGAAGAGAAWGVIADRDVVRDHLEPPLQQLDLKSPLAGYRQLYKDYEDEVLFTVAGLPAGEPRLRLASMDDFDGIVWNVTTTDDANGTSAFKPAPASVDADSVAVQVGAYPGPWVPSVGTAAAATRSRDADPDASRDLLINPETGALLALGGVRAGDVYDVDWEPDADRGELPRDARPDPEVFAPALDFGTIEPLDDLTQRWISEAGATTSTERLDAIERGFQQGYFNDGIDPTTSGYANAGHGVRRLLDLVATPERMVGNDEQYASAMAYAAQRLGMPARVVMGFEQVGADGAVTGDDIAAWVEVAFAGHGWVVYDPTPSEDRIPPPLSAADNPAPQPIVIQPPVLPEEPEEVQGLPPEGAPGQLDDEIWELLLRILGYLWIVLQVLALLSPLWLVLLAKWVRRRRRRRAPVPSDALSGAWRELADVARDLGIRVPRGHTRHEVGSLIATRVDDQDLVTLAAVADRHIFGAGQPSGEEVEDYWQQTRAATRRMRRASPWHRRVVGRVSPASLPWRDYGAGLARAGRWAARLTGVPRVARWVGSRTSAGPRRRVRAVA